VVMLLGWLFVNKNKIHGVFFFIAYQRQDP
jgi:hypothetical protein